MASSPAALRPADAPAAVVSADVSVRMAPVGEAARREVRYHMRRIKRDGRWHVALLLPPLASGLPAEHDLARIEIDPDGVRRSYDRAGREMKPSRRATQRQATQPRNANPMLARIASSIEHAERAGAGAAGTLPQPQYVVHAGAAASARESLVARYGTPGVRDGREVFTVDDGQAQSSVHFDPRIGAVVRVDVAGRDGSALDMAITYEQVRPGLYVRNGISYVVSLPGMKTAIRSETSLTNIHVEGQP